MHDIMYPSDRERRARRENPDNRRRPQLPRDRGGDLQTRRRGGRTRPQKTSDGRREVLDCRAAGDGPAVRYHTTDRE